MARGQFGLWGAIWEEAVFEDRYKQTTGKRVTVFQLKPYGKGMGVILIEDGAYELRHGNMR